MREYNYYVYITTNKAKKPLYAGVTNNLFRRIQEHKEKIFDGFSKKYNCNRLVYYEHGTHIEGAIAREKQIKKWRREKKIRLIEEMNPKWEDLYEKMEL